MRYIRVAGTRGEDDEANVEAAMRRRTGKVTQVRSARTAQLPVEPVCKAA